MRMRRALWAAGLVCGLGLGALIVPGGCGGSPTTGTRGEMEGEAKERSAAHGEKMKEFMQTKKANQWAKKGSAPK
jgi:hypothetical protein